MVVNGDTYAASDEQILQDLGSVAEEVLAIRQTEQLTQTFTSQDNILHYAIPIALAKQYTSLEQTILKQYCTPLVNDMRSMLNLSQRWQFTLATLTTLSDYYQSVKDIQYGQLQSSIFTASTLFTVLSAMNILLVLWLRADLTILGKISITLISSIVLLLVYLLIRQQTHQRHYANQHGQQEL